MLIKNESSLRVTLGPELADYGFDDGHPFHRQRQAAFERGFDDKGLRSQCVILDPRMASEDELRYFHTVAHVARVKAQAKLGQGALDFGDTPARKGIFEAASAVAGSTLDAMRRILSGEFQRAFIPIAGLHHAARNAAAGFCVFNDCGVAIEVAFREFGVMRIAYVDIDAHHGDGVYYGFEDDPRLIFADFHQDGRTLYPGTGHAGETGKGEGLGYKLNIPLPPGANDDLFAQLWGSAERFIDEHAPQMILLQCGADSIAGDPITGLGLSPKSHALAVTRLRELANRHCQGRLLAMGGGGYAEQNIAVAWTAVVEALI